MWAPIGSKLPIELLIHTLTGIGKQGLLNSWEKSANMSHRNQKEWKEKEFWRETVIMEEEKNLQNFVINSLKDTLPKKEVDILKDMFRGRKKSSEK